MHTVKRAIIMAAGFGSRMQPVTLTTPKPLVKVNGMRMIDTVIQGLHHNGIQEIYIVAGYLKEQFYALEIQYPGVKIIENPYYDICNNISSLYVAREHLEDVMILDGDQIIYNDKILDPSFERSGYNCVWTDSQTDDCQGRNRNCLQPDRRNRRLAALQHLTLVCRRRQKTKATSGNRI